MYPFGSCFSLDICTGVGLQCHMIALFLVFKGAPILLSIVAVPIYIPTNNSVGCSLLSTPSPAFIACGLFDDDLSGWCEVIPYCSFDLHFSND